MRCRSCRNWSFSQQSVSELTRTLAADPLLAEARMTFGRVFMSMRQPDRALPYLREAVELSPLFSFAREQLGHAYLQQGKHHEAIAAFERTATTAGASDSAQLAYAYAVSSRRPEARTILRALLAEHDPWFGIGFAVAPAFEPLRTDPRYAPLVRRIGLVP